MTTNEIVIAVVAAVLVVFSLTVAMVVPRRNPDFPGRRLGAFFLVSMVLVAGMLLSVQFFGVEDAEDVAHATAEAGGEGETGAQAETGAEGETGAEEGGGGAPQGDAAAGEEVFASAGCGSCHELAAAAATGAVGPSLDESRPPFELVVDRVTNGAGAMPAFGDQLSEQQIEDVAAYVVQATAE